MTLTVYYSLYIVTLCIVISSYTVTAVFQRGIYNMHLNDFYQPAVIRWSPEVQNIFYRGNKRNLLPGSRDKLEHFFNCAATLMTRHLQNLALDFAADYIDLLIQPPVSSSLRDVHQFSSTKAREGFLTCRCQTEPLPEKLRQ